MEYAGQQQNLVPRTLEHNTPKEDPEVIVRTVMQEVAAMGRNDHEMSSLAEILRRYRSTDPNDHLSASDAIAAARAIMENKQDYN